MMEFNRTANIIFAFDFDGVLCDSMDMAIKEINRLQEERYPALPKISNQEDLAYLFSGPLKTSLRRFGLNDKECREFFDAHSAKMCSRANSNHLFKDVAKLFIALPKANKYVVTSAYSDAVNAVFKKSGYENFLPDAQILGRELAMPKSAKFDIIRNTSNIVNPRIIKIGDMVSDILYAKTSGVEIISVGWGYHPYNYLNGFAPHALAENYEEFRSIISSVLDGALLE